MTGTFRGTQCWCEINVREVEGAAVLGAFLFGLRNQADAKITGVNLGVVAAATILIGTEILKFYRCFTENSRRRTKA